MATPNPLTSVVDRLRAAGCVFAEDEALLLADAAGTPAELVDMVDRRVSGLPLEHVLGWAEFCGLRIAVDPGVFVPRRRTELLVREAAAVVRAAARGAGARSSGEPTVVVDLCCGSGALGAALVAILDSVDLYAVDVDPAAVRCARRNIPVPAGEVYVGDLYDPLPATLRGRVDIVVANTPYVPSGSIGLLPPEARTHEPLIALDGGTDGLDIARRVAADATRWLAPGGHLLVETSERQAPKLADAFARSGLTPRVTVDEELGATAVMGTPDLRFTRRNVAQGRDGHAPSDVSPGEAEA